MTKRKAGSKTKARNTCGLCGRSGKLTKTPCCGQWICDDADEYVLFSYARNSCWRNHDHYTLCAYHYHENHGGDWKDCDKCRESIQPEMYVWYGTNEYNFEVLPDPPSFEPTKCSDCGKVISLSEEGYSTMGDDYWCEACSHRRMMERFSKDT